MHLCTDLYALCPFFSPSNTIVFASCELDIYLCRGKYNQLHSNQVVGCLDQRYKMHVDFSADWVNIV